MIELRRIKTAEDPLVIYHYIFGELLGCYRDKFFTWTKDEVKQYVFDTRERYTTWDFNANRDGKRVAVVSLTDIDYENLNAKLSVTLSEPAMVEDLDTPDIIKQLGKFAFHQLGLVRVSGVLTIDGVYRMILEDVGFKLEASIEGAAYREGRRRPLRFFGLLKHDFEELGVRD